MTLSYGIEFSLGHKSHTVVASKDWGAMDFLKAAAHHEDGVLKQSFKEHLDRPAAAKGGYRTISILLTYSCSLVPFRFSFRSTFYKPKV
jgi:hypothetical protein